jgi:hypothetical protein
MTSSTDTFQNKTYKDCKQKPTRKQQRSVTRIQVRQQNSSLQQVIADVIKTQACLTHETGKQR